MQASPSININSEHNFDSDAVLLINECRRVIDGSHSRDPAQRWAHASIAAGQVLKWLKRASPGDLRAIRVKGVERMLIVDMFTSVMTCYAVKCMEPVNRSGTALIFDKPELRHKVLEMLSKCAELGCVASKLMLARMHFECKNAVVRQLLLLEFYGVNPATALEYLLEAADVITIAKPTCSSGNCTFRVQTGDTDDQSICLSSLLFLSTLKSRSTTSRKPSSHTTRWQSRKR